MSQLNRFKRASESVSAITQTTYGSWFAKSSVSLTPDRPTTQYSATTGRIPDVNRASQSNFRQQHPENDIPHNRRLLKLQPGEIRL